MWATWCGPCKAEFKHNDQLGELLDKYEVEKIFVSIDRERDKQKWKDDIKYFGLKGTHILANQEFKDDFAQNYSIHPGGFAIPQYLYVNEKGEVVSSDAPRPSDSAELEALLQ